MQIVFFVCNETAAREFIYADIPGSGMNFVSREGGKKERERFCVESALFSLKEDIWLDFQVCGGRVRFLKGAGCAYRLLQGGKEVKAESYGEREQNVFSIITIHRERLWMCLCLGKAMKAALYQTGIGVISVGRGPDNTICCPREDMLSERHLCIRRSGQRTVLLMEGRNGGYLNQTYLGRYERTVLRYGDVIRLFGWTLLWLGELLAVYSLSGAEAVVRLEKCGLELSDSGGADITACSEKFFPVPRNRLLPDREAIELEAPPERRESEKQSLFLVIGPAFTMALPMLLGFGMAAWNNGGGNGQLLSAGLVTAASSAVLGGFWAYMNIRRHRKSLRISERRRRVVYQNYVADCERKIREKYRGHQNMLRGLYPAIEDCMCGTGRLPHLWNRTKQDEDFLACRVGIGNLPFDVPIVIPKERFSVTADLMKELPLKLKKKYGVLKEVPVCINLKQERLCGVVAGSREDLAELLWMLALQIGILGSTRQVRLIILLVKTKVPAAWLTWLRWLPHLWTEEAHLLALDLARARELVHQAEQMLKEPEEREKYWIVFTDDYTLLGQTLTDDDNVSILLFASNYGELPSVCRSILLKSSGFSGQIMLKADPTLRRELRFDSVCREAAEDYARKLCGLAFRAVQEKSEIPKKVTIFELLIKKTNAAAICENWRMSRSEDSLCVEIGVTRGGRNCCLDAHERGHGPHGLIAGMTGSGKSEMLQTIILSLAMKFSPLETGFFLIDYKGGGMANLFAGLPHLLGSISNLSGGMIYRAMVSIRSENERRQRLFLSASVNHIYDYQRLYRSGLVKVPLPHIFIIIDEFAELKREEPDFMRELVSVAQVGRSLGVHLLLATQKPSGTVDDNIWSNARFRICLRVQDKQDSNEMLHRPDAAFLTNPGRAILQVGNDELYETFQGAYTMEPYLEGGQEKESVQLLDEYGRKCSFYVPPDAVRENGRGCKTQIRRLLEEIVRAADFMGCPKPESLWLPLLPDTLYLEELYSAGQMQEEAYQIPVGRYDDPRHQKQGIYTISLPGGGHHVICGIAACGKSTFLQTVLYAFIEKENPETLQIYIVDYSSRLLSEFAQSRLVGGVMTEEEQEELPKLFHMLKGLLLERKKLFQGGSFLQYRAANTQAPPAILLMIDHYGGFREKTGGIYDGDMQELAKLGENYGIYLMLTASGIGGQLEGRLFESCKTGICLSMSDKYRCCEVLRTVQLPLKPPENSRGRGIAWIEGEPLEFQCALCLKSQNDYERMEKLRQRIQRRNEAYPHSQARRIPRIPKRPVLEEFFSMLDEAGWRPALATDFRKEALLVGCGLPVGYEEQSGNVYSIPFREIRHVFVTGKRKTGKHNCLKVIKQVARRYGIFFREIGSIGELAACVRENEEKISQGRMTQGKASQEFAKHGFLYLIPEFGRLCDEFYMKQDQKGSEMYLTGILGKKSLHKVVAIVRKEDMGSLSGRPLFEELAQEAYGIHMGGALDSQSLFDFSYVPFSRQSAAKTAGHGTVPKCAQAPFFGDIILPLCEEIEHELYGYSGSAACGDL